jgi:RNA polymerase sigma-70 factor (ECF subfamily)
VTETGLLECKSVSDGKGWTADAFRDHERHVWSIAYRMTGSADDADDVVQETFTRAIARPPQDVDLPVRPWLTRVAMNASRDMLRRRKSRAYVGPWLPSPVETADLEGAAALERGEAEPDASARYDLRESASFAFLVALEALTPQQRAVLLLRDVFDYTVSETAEALALSLTNVKTTHHRARRAMADYDRTRRPASPELAAARREALHRFVSALLTQDAAAVEACLAEDARALSDGGGEYVAALRPVEGRNRVARFLVGLQKKRDWRGRFAIESLNGDPALVAEFEGTGLRWAPRLVLRVEVNAAGAVSEVHMVLAPPKLRRVRSPPP